MKLRQQHVRQKEIMSTGIAQLAERYSVIQMEQASMKGLPGLFLKQAILWHIVKLRYQHVLNRAILNTGPVQSARSRSVMKTGKMR